MDNAYKSKYVNAAPIRVIRLLYNAGVSVKQLNPLHLTSCLCSSYGGHKFPCVLSNKVCQRFSLRRH